MILKKELNEISYEEASCNSNQVDRHTDFLNFRKKKINNFQFIYEIINLIPRLLFLFMKFALSEFYIYSICERFIKKFSPKKKILITYSLKDKEPNSIQKFNFKEFNHINFHAPFLNFNNRKKFGKIDFEIINISLIKFFKSAFYVFKKKESKKKLILYFLNDLMKLERLYLYMFVFEILKNKNFFKIKKIYFFYENLTRDFIVNKYLKNEFEISAIITTPILQYKRKNITSIGHTKILPKNFIFFFEEKKIAFIKLFGNRFNKSSFIQKKKNFRFKLKSMGKKNLKILLSNDVDEEILFEKIQRTLDKRNIELFYHPLSKNYSKKKYKLNKNDFIIVSDKTNAGYYLANKGYKVLIYVNHIDSPYKFIKINKYKYKQIIKLLN